MIAIDSRDRGDPLLCRDDADEYGEGGRSGAPTLSWEREGDARVRGCAGERDVRLRLRDSSVGDAYGCPAETGELVRWRLRCGWSSCNCWGAVSRGE